MMKFKHVYENNKAGLSERVLLDDDICDDLLPPFDTIIPSLCKVNDEIASIHERLSKSGISIDDLVESKKFLDEAEESSQGILDTTYNYKPFLQIVARVSELGDNFDKKLEEMIEDKYDKFLNYKKQLSITKPNDSPSRMKEIRDNLELLTNEYFSIKDVYIGRSLPISKLAKLSSDFEEYFKQIPEIKEIDLEYERLLSSYRDIASNDEIRSFKKYFKQKSRELKRRIKTIEYDEKGLQIDRLGGELSYLNGKYQSVFREKNELLESIKKTNNNILYFEDNQNVELTPKELRKANSLLTDKTPKTELIYLESLCEVLDNSYKKLHGILKPRVQKEKERITNELRGSLSDYDDILSLPIPEGDKIVQLESLSIRVSELKPYIDTLKDDRLSEIYDSQITRNAETISKLERIVDLKRQNEIETQQKKEIQEKLRLERITRESEQNKLELELERERNSKSSQDVEKIQEMLHTYKAEREDLLNQKNTYQKKATEEESRASKLEQENQDLTSKVSKYESDLERIRNEFSSPEVVKNKFALQKYMHAFPASNNHIPGKVESILKGQFGAKSWNDRLSKTNAFISRQKPLEDEDDIAYLENIANIVEEDGKSGYLASLFRNSGYDSELISDFVCSIRDYTEKSKVNL